MTFSTVISTVELARQLANTEWAIVDCRFSLDDADRGRRDYVRAHIPGAVYAHLDEDLSGAIRPGITGRHPLPEPETFAKTLGDWGIGDGVQVVAYDDAGGAFASRLWWMLRWLGHESVAVLDGGWPLWIEEGRPVRGGDESRPARSFVPRPRAEWLVDTGAIEALLNSPDQLLYDARSADRYRGENETIDPVAGHIPGAISAPYLDNLDAEGLFRSKEELLARYEELLAGKPAAEAVFYCGSGVSAAHNLLAMAHSGLEPARLYAGSWSEWITNPSRPTSGPDAASPYPGYGVFGPSAFSEESEIVLVAWNNEEGITRLTRSSHKQDFYRLAHTFQPQINPLYCGIASAVVVLNGFRMPGGRAQSQNDLEVERPEELGGGRIPFTSYSQLTLLNERTDLVKPREVINMTAVNGPDGKDSGSFDAGLSIADLGKILELYGTTVEVTHAEQAIEGGAGLFRDVVRAVLGDEASFLVLNFLGSDIGTTTGGHISPLGAYDEQTDSILVLDVAGHKTPWYWAPIDHLYQSMNTLAGDAYRGWLVISDS